MEKQIVLYHRIMRRENFEKAAKDLFNLLKTAQTKSPNRPRVLFVDIDGHRNKKGGYDSDMLELQKDFGIGFLGKYFTEVHFPLIEFQNPNPQCNDIPSNLEIFSAENKTDDRLNKLYIENYSNTEFVSEADIYDYLKKVHDFLIEYRDFDSECMIRENNNTSENSYIRLWKNHISDLINEFFNAFIYGNLLSVAAMTRTLIECFVYFSILSKEENKFLIHDWYLCSLCHSLGDHIEKAKEAVELYCRANKLNFNEKWDTYQGAQNTNKWLRQIIPAGRLTFKAACDYLEDDHIYKDFESACSFVHGQDITSKMMPFTFYASVCYRFHMMMSYIYRTIRLFPLNESLENQITQLEDELILLAEKYYR